MLHRAPTVLHAPPGIITGALALMLAACTSSATPAPAPVAPRASAPGGTAAITEAPASTSGGPPPAGTVDPYRLTPGSWSGGSLHIEVTGGIEATFDLPFVSGETADGRTTLVFENQDDEQFSKGLVRVSVFFDANSIGVEAGEIRIQGPCEIAFSEVAEDGLAGDVTCGEDVGATLAGDPREVQITGMFSGSR